MKKEISRDFVRELSLAGDVSVKTPEVVTSSANVDVTTITTELVEVSAETTVTAVAEQCCC